MEAGDEDAAPQQQEALPDLKVAKRLVSVHFDCTCSDEDYVRMAKEMQEDPRLLDGEGGESCPPLLHAVLKEHPRCVAFFLECGAEVNQEYKTLGETPLSSAVTRSTPDIARMLLAHDASGINTKSSITNESPLVKAVKHGNPQIVRLLLEYGARPNSTVERNGEVVPCVYLAIELAHETIVTDLLTFGATLYGHSHFDKNNLLYKHMQFAISEGQLETVRSLCLYGALKELCKITLYPNLSTTIHCNFTLLCVIFRNQNELETNIRMVNILHEFGFNFWKCDKHDPNAWKKIEKLQKNDFTQLLVHRIKRIRSQPMSLKQLCRIWLLKFFEYDHVNKVAQLNIPNSLVPFLKFNDVK